MMRSMYSAVSGLKNHQTRMDVIGNNIANVNTAGYKKSRVVFKDTLYQNIRGASRPTDARGGTNPMGVGLGMTLASIDQIHTPSPTTVTNKLTDMAVDGNGYFLVNNGGERFYTRAGNFDFDKVGNLVMTSNGYYVQGWMADATGKIDPAATPGKIDISGYKTVEPRATTEMRFSGNLNSNMDKGWEDDPSKINITDSLPEGYTAFDSAEGTPNNAYIREKEIYDSLGNKETIYFRFYKVWDKAPNEVDASYQWFCDISLDPEFKGTIGEYTAPDETSTSNMSDVVRVAGIQFNKDGSLNTGEVKELNLIVDRAQYNAENINFKVDFSPLTQYESKSDAWPEYQDGYTMGNLTSYSVGTDGTIFGVYDNGESRNLARVAVANFENPGGLLQRGSNLYQESNNSGDARIGAPGEQGMGAIIPGSLEMSNVDLSEEFTDMIVTQRGFQANSRIITTSDEMLQELVNLKR